MATNASKNPNIIANTSLSGCLEQIITTLFKSVCNLKKGAFRGEIDSIHGMRVATIKLLSVLEAFSPCFKKKNFKKNFTRVKKILKSLGMVRKYDVIQEVVEKYWAKTKEIRPLISKFSHRRSTSQKSLKNIIIKFNKADYKKKYYKFASKSLVSTNTVDIEMPLRDGIVNILTPMAGTMVDNLIKAIKEPTFIEELHKTRIEAKPLKAISEISISLFDNSFKNCFNEVKNVLSVMGEIHDLDEVIAKIEKKHKKKWYNGLQPGLIRIRSDRSVLFEKLGDITVLLQNTDFVRRFILAMQYKNEIEKGETQ